MRARLRYGCAKNLAEMAAAAGAHSDALPLFVQARVQMRAARARVTARGGGEAGGGD